MVSLPTSYPLGPPSLSGTTYTLDWFLQQPTRVTSYLSDLSLRDLFAVDIFTPAGGVTGGAVLYDQLTLNDLYPDRDVQNVEPGAEFPIVTSSRQAPLLAQVEKFGGKFFATDEQRDRNDAGIIRREGQKVANAITRKTNTRALAVLDASISTFSRTAAGLNWTAVVTGGSSQTNNTAWPAADFARVKKLGETEELGVNFDTFILNPQEAYNFDLIYGGDGASVLARYGIRFIVSNRVTAGTAYVVASGQVGEFRVEKGLSTETWREQATQRTWIQTDVRPVMYVTSPYAAFKLTGLAG